MEWLKMMLSNRQTSIGCARVPTIIRIPDSMVEFNKEHDKFRKLMIEALSKRFKEYHETIADCVSQSLAFLCSMGATKDMDKIKEIKLWKKFVDMSPIYEGIAVQLTTMLTKHHCPQMYEQMNKGHVYSHYKLTVIKETVLYVMEYFAKENLLLSTEDFIRRPNVEKWLTEN